MSYCNWLDNVMSYTMFDVVLYSMLLILPIHPVDP